MSAKASEQWKQGSGMSVKLAVTQATSKSKPRTITTGSGNTADPNGSVLVWACQTIRYLFCVGLPQNDPAYIVLTFEAGKIGGSEAVDAGLRLHFRVPRVADGRKELNDSRILDGI